MSILPVIISTQELQHCVEHCAIVAVTGINNNVINTMVASIMFAVPETNLVDS